MLDIERYTGMGALQTTFRVCRRHFGLFFAISLIGAVPSVLATAALNVKMQSAPDDPSAGLRMLPVALVASVLGGAFATTACTRVVSGLALGNEPTLRGIFGETLAIFGRVIPAALLALLALGGLAFASGVALTAGTGGGGASAMLGLVLGIGGVVGLVRLGMSWILVVPVTALEPIGARAALLRSSGLMHGRRLKVFGALLRLALIAVIVQGVAYLLSEQLPGNGFGAQIDKELLLAVASAIVTPLMNVALVLFYFDARVDLEGFDVDVLAQQMGPPPEA